MEKVKYIKTNQLRKEREERTRRRKKERKNLI